MGFKRVCLVAAVILCGTLQAASAAPASKYDWTGFYVGGHFGYGWGSGDAVGISSTGVLFTALMTSGAIPTSLGVSPQGWLGGFQLGQNYQTGKMVYGFEADISFTGIHGNTSVTRPGPILPFATYTTSVDQRMNWFNTLRARAGMEATDNLLVYATGGLAIGQVDLSGNIHRTAILLNYNVPGSASVTKVGWTIGAGGEYALRNKWSVKAEYLYYDLGKTDTTGNLTTLAGVVTAPQATYSFTTRGSIVRLGLNFKTN